MDEDKRLAELKFHFEKSMEKLSNKCTSHISTAWEKLVDLHQCKPYHNLYLAYNDLKTAQELLYTVPSNVIVAAVLRYAEFDPTKSNNTEQAVTSAEFFLSQPFGWNYQNIRDVTDCIRGSFQIVAPSNQETFPVRLMHDMKISRFSRKPQEFITDRQNAKKEFNHVGERKFYSSEAALLKCYDNIPNLFSLDGFNPLLPKIKETIRNRISYLAEMEKYLDSRDGVNRLQQNKKDSDKIGIPMYD